MPCSVVETREKVGLKGMHVLIVSDHALRIVLSLKSLKKGCDMVTANRVNRDRSIKIHDLKSISFRSDIAMNPVVPMIHDGFELRKLGILSIRSPIEAFTFIEHVDDFHINV